MKLIKVKILHVYSQINAFVSSADTVHGT